ncbi:flagellar filament capping protein FliD [Sulfurirhabdus autotrophica]|uniref:Flagellar hook-associated protein n=1 Tax=Sulfurirhabdus autotrophica TaxID=1706046 RepID=A0A4R3YF25_9PROT|nr:flagellar filament capping protein FliD [Sulfurirhabdus autotrophica]TCV90561.1 flagellar hook-associated protein [Sulfurirhabdus autotrophica]
MINISPASFTQSIANFQSQALSALFNSSSDAKNSDFWATIAPLVSSKPEATNPLTALANSSSINGLSPTGRNLALFDPESAFQMMSVINNKDVSYKAQFSELSQMKAYVSKMQDEGQSLSGITLSTGNDSIKTQLQGFVSEYNSWVERFTPDMQKNGLLADTQAAQVSLYELDQSIKNTFFGVKDDVHGLKDLGMTIDPNTKLAVFDSVKLDNLLATNKQGVVNTLQEFGGNFAKSASLLNADNNFIPNQLNNLNKVIHYIADNKDDLQAEFGTGNLAKPVGQVALALAAYNQTYNT